MLARGCAALQSVPEMSVCNSTDSPPASDGAERKKAAGLASCWPLEGRRCLQRCFQSSVRTQNQTVE